MGLPLTSIDTLFSLQKVIFEAAKEGKYFVHPPTEVRCLIITGSGSSSKIDVSDRKAFDDPDTWKSILEQLVRASSELYIT